MSKKRIIIILYAFSLPPKDIVELPIKENMRNQHQIEKLQKMYEDTDSEFKAWKERVLKE